MLIMVPAGIVIAGAAIGVGARAATGIADGARHHVCRLMGVPDQRVRATQIVRRVGPAQFFWEPGLICTSALNALVQVY